MLLFRFALPRNYAVWLRHGLAVLVASIWSWANPIWSTFVPTGVSGGIAMYELADAGFPFVYRAADLRESSSLLLLNHAIGLIASFASFAVVGGILRISRLMPGKGAGVALKRWFVVSALLLSYVHLSGEGNGIGGRYCQDFHFSFDRITLLELDSSALLAEVLGALIGCLLVLAALRYDPARSWHNATAFAAFYVMANLQTWWWLRDLLDDGIGRGFPFRYDWLGNSDQSLLLMANTAIGIVLT